MTEFELLARRAAATGTLDADELRRIHACATFAPIDDGLAQTLGMLGGNEISAARIIADQIGDRRKLEATIRDAISGERRPTDVARFAREVANQRGRPPADIAQALGVMATDWSTVADAIERRLSPPKQAARGGEIHEVHA
jgi:hypothetical protein